MNTPVILAALGLSLLLPSIALAQDPEPAPSAPAPTPAPTPVSAPAEAPPAARVRCALGTHAGLDDADAQTAGRIVCDAVAREGAPAGARYRVDLGKLGAAVMLSVAREGDAPGSTADTREIRLQSIEEVPVAAPRLATAIVHGTAMAETETTDNLVGEETRRPRTKPGSLHFGLGLIGMLPPLDQGVAPAAGVLLDLHYEASRIELGGGLRGGGSASSSDCGRDSPHP